LLFCFFASLRLNADAAPARIVARPIDRDKQDRTTETAEIADHVAADRASNQSIRNEDIF